MSTLLTRSLGLAREYATPMLRFISTISRCPDPKLCCQIIPEGLDIERELDMSNSIPPYTEQILISTGKSDWSSRIEDDASGILVKKLKELLGPKGKYNNPSRNILLTHSSFRASKTDTSSILPQNSTSSQPSSSTSNTPTSAYLLPSFRHVSDLSAADDSIERFVSDFVTSIDSPELAKTSPNAESRIQEGVLARSTAVNDILILICSHGNRDSRCGILGPILQAEFHSKLPRFGVAASEHASVQHNGFSAQVGLISHIGGHRWAGNVIIAIPPHLAHHLAGKVIWYGRVSPTHVEGIVHETVIRGNIIKELYRGGIDQHRTMIKL